MYYQIRNQINLITTSRDHPKNTSRNKSSASCCRHGATALGRRLQCLPVLCRGPGLRVASGLRVLHRSPGGLVVEVRGGTAVLRQCPGLRVVSGLRVLNRSPGGLVVEAVEEVRREEVVEVVREVREVVEGVVDLRPSPPAANPAADTVSRPRPTPPTDSQAHGRHRPRPYAPMAVGRDRTSRISPPIGAAPAHARPRRPSPALLDHGCS